LRRFLFAAVCLCVAGAGGSLSSQAPRLGLLAGKVVDAETGRPIESALVRMTSSTTQVLTDREGRFAFFDLRQGGYRFGVTATGYDRLATGQSWAVESIFITPAGRTPESIELKEGERRDDVVIRMTRLSAISGVVTDEAGEPAVGVQVQAWPRIFVAGRPWFNSRFPYFSNTDDRGAYRIDALQAGDLIVVVPVPSVTVPSTLAPFTTREPGWSPELYRLLDTFQRHTFLISPSPALGTAVSRGTWVHAPLGQPSLPSGSAEPRAYPATFFPGSSTPTATSFLRVLPGVEMEGVDIQLRSTQAGSVFGTVVGPSDRVSGLTVQLVQTGAAEIDGDSGVAVSDSRGRFAFLDVPYGTYRVSVRDVPRGGPPSSFVPGGGHYRTLIKFHNSPWDARPMLWADASISVNSALMSDVVVPLREGVRFTGRVVFEGQTKPPSPAELVRILIELDPADGRLRNLEPSDEIDVNESGEFQSIGVAPGNYFLQVPNPPAGWLFDGAMLEDRDISILPAVVDSHPVSNVLIKFTDRKSELRGSVRSSTGDPDRNATILVFPADRTRWTDFGKLARQFMSGRSNDEGQFVVPNVPGGSYYVVAVPDTDVGEWRTPEAMQALAGSATSVRMEPHSQRTIDLVTVRSR
jgi:hypothetical protein